VRAPWRVVTDDVAVVGRGSAEGGGGGSRSGRRGSFGALPGGCWGSVLRWSVTSPWRAVAELFERLCETSRRGRGGGRRWVARGSPSPPRRVVPCVSTAWAGDPSERSWRRVPRDCPRGLRKPPDGSSRSLPWVSREAPPSGHRGSRQAPFQGVRRAHQGRPAGAFERPAPGHVQGSSWAREGRHYGGRRAVGSWSGNVVSSVSRASYRRVAIGPTWDLGKTYFGSRATACDGRLATLCDSRLRHAVKAVERERARGG
jgi:hypothetical protein